MNGDYEIYAEMCENMGLSYSEGDRINGSTYKILKALCDRINKLEEDSHRHSNMSGEDRNE